MQRLRESAWSLPKLKLCLETAVTQAKPATPVEGRAIRRAHANMNAANSPVSTISLRWVLPWLLAASASCGVPEYTRTGGIGADYDGGIGGYPGVTGQGGGTGGRAATGGTGAKGSGGAGTGGGKAATGGSSSAGHGGGAGLAGTAGGGSGGKASAGTGGAGSTGPGTGGAGSTGAGTGGMGSTGAGTGGMGSAGAGTGGTGSLGGAPGNGGAGSNPGTGGGAPADSAKYNFETSAQAWKMAAGGGTIASVGQSTTEHFAGTAALAGAMTTASGMTYILEVAPPTPAIAPGTVVTFHVFVPAGAPIGSIQPYVLETGSYRFTGARIYAKDLTLDAWTTVKVTVPADAAAILRLGVQFDATATWTGTVYVDSVDW